MSRAAEMETIVQHKARQTLYAFPNETQTNSTCNKRPNNIMQALSKVRFSPQGVISRDLVRSQKPGEMVIINTCSIVNFA